MATIAYLDNNATTIMPTDVVREMIAWTNQGNPSASYASAKKCAAMIERFRAFLASAVGCTLAQYAVVFTSGATESNSMILHGIIEQVRRRGAPFHVVVSAIEHKSVLRCVQDALDGIPTMSVSYVRATVSGHIRPEDVAAAIKPTTVLVACMHANNETGAINNIAEISRVVKARGRDIFMFSDTVQSFGKIPLRLCDFGIDGASISFHKLHGPPGVGAALIRRAYLEGFPALLHGTQSAGLRGGTENVPGIGAAFAATRTVLAKRAETAEHERALKEHLIARLGALAPVTSIDAYMGAREKLELQIVLIANGANVADSTQYLPGTLMLSVAKHIGSSACNSLIKDKLEAAGVIVSVGSACNTKSKEHSHVLQSMGIPTLLMDGAIRVSMCGYTTREEIDRFIDGFIREANRQYQITKSGREIAKK